MNELIQMWIFDPLDFFVKKVIQISKYELNIDEECNSNSIFYSCEQNIGYKELDIVFVKKNNSLVYSGIIENGERNNDKEKITCKDIINIFNEKISIVSDVGNSFEYLIKTVGIEDFIKSQIDTNFAWGSDYISSRNFINTTVKTHTPLNISVETENNIYNLATFMQNCRQNYDIKYYFSIDTENIRLNIDIYLDSSNTSKFVDLSKVSQEGLKEIYSSNILAKVTVVTENGQYYLYMKNDRTTTTDGSDENIVFGKRTTVFTKSIEDARQEALNQFKSNKYEHYFTWNDTKDYSVGEKLFIKTTKGDILETYISAKKESSDSTIKTYICGKLRVKFIDKFLQEKYGG